MTAPRDPGPAANHLDDLLRMAWWNAIFNPASDLPALEKRIGALLAAGALWERA